MVKKKGFKILVILILFLITYMKICYGFSKDDYNSDILVIGWEGASSKKILSDLKEKFNYDGELTKEIKLKTDVKITKKKKAWLGLGGYTYKIKFRGQ